MPLGAYLWFAVVDGDANGVIDGTSFDYVLTIRAP